MNGYFDKPNLPDKKVSLAVCGRHNQVIIDFIKSTGIRLIISDNNEQLDAAISNHIDLSVHHLGGKDIIINRNNPQLYKILSDDGFNIFFSEIISRSPYPYDCSLNCFKAGEYLFCNNKIIDKNIPAYFEYLKIADVKQGYCKCSVLLLDDKSFITDDISIFEKGKELSFDCILIEKGDILLKGYDYGFIGGASAKIADDTVIFFGDITKHRSFTLIDKFIKDKGMNYIFSYDFPLTDIGGIIPLK